MLFDLFDLNDIAFTWFLHQLISYMSHLVLAYFASNSQWEFIYYSDISGYFVMSYFSMTIGEEVFSFSHAWLFQLNPCTNFFSEEFIIDSNNLGICYVRMLCQVFLDLTRVDVLSSSDNHVLSSTNNFNISIIIEKT